MDVVSYKQNKIVAAGLDVPSKNLGVSSVPLLSSEDVYALSPNPIDGIYHSDVASSESQPNLMQRVAKLPKSFAPSGMSDDELISTAIPRACHDIADIEDMTNYLAHQVETSLSSDPGATSDPVVTSDPGTPTSDPGATSDPGTNS